MYRHYICVLCVCNKVLHIYIIYALTKRYIYMYEFRSVFVFCMHSTRLLRYIIPVMKLRYISQCSFFTDLKSNL